ncbi:MAG TPA: hypothetical protein V6D50_08290 [Chroococcales cyanobacterium]
MSPSVNRSTDSPQSSGVESPDTSSVQSQHSEMPTVDSPNDDQLAENTAEPTETMSTETMSSDIQRQQPIPPPSEPRQYRAIGLIRGQYMPSAEQLTRGTLLAADGTLIDAVLLGRVMSLVKNHLELDQSHLWVVYPRTRQEDGNLHVQIVGVWEPEKLNQKASTELSSTGEASVETAEEKLPEASDPEAVPVVNEGYFSIRGEVIYQSREQEEVIVKIKQAPRKEADKIKFFKLKLKGLLGDKVIGHFWDLHLLLQGNDLQIQQANDIGLIPKKRRPPTRPFNNKKRRPPNKGGPNQRQVRKGGERPAATATQTPPKRREPLPKPVKRNDQRGGGNTSG